MSPTHEWILLLILVVMMLVLLFLLNRTPIGEAVREKIPDRPRRRLFVASVSFFLTFATVRGMVFAITHNIPPFHYVIVEGKHIHHLVFGIVILLWWVMAGCARLGMAAIRHPFLPAVQCHYCMDWARRSRSTNLPCG